MRLIFKPSFFFKPNNHIMNRKPKSLLIIGLLMILPLWAFSQERAGEGAGIGELTNQYTCKIQGYTIKVYRPAHVPANANTRQIHVETHAISFYARWPELSVLLQYPALVIDYQNLGMQNIPPYEYCDRNGYTIVDENAWYVQTQNPNNYTGYTNDLDGSNLDTANRNWLVTVFNQYKVQHHIDEIPSGCVEGCLDNSGHVPDDPDDGVFPGGYTLADGAVEDWDFDEFFFGGSGTTISVGGVIARPSEGFNRPGSSSCLTGFDASLYLPLMRRNRITLGVNVSGAYHDHGGVYCWGSGSVSASDLTDPIPMDHGQSELRFHEGDVYSQTRIQGGAGLQLNVNLTRRFMISAIARAGYMNINQSAYSIIQHNRIGDGDIAFNLLQLPETDHSSFYYSPGLRLGFAPGRYVQFWTGIDYTFGGSSTYEYQGFVPHGEPNDQGFYSFDAIRSGETRSQSAESDNTFLGISAGISFLLWSR